MLVTGDQAAALSGAFQEAFAATLPDVDLQIRPVEGRLEYGRLLQDGQADVALLFADTAYLSYVGEIVHPAHDKLRGLATLNPTPVVLLVRRGSHVRSIRDLRGLRVNLGKETGVLASPTRLVLEVFGVRVRATHLPLAQALAEMDAGTLDATFASGLEPADHLTAAIRRGAQVIPLSPQDIADVHQHYLFLRGMLVSRGPFSEKPVLTLALDRLVVCRSDLGEELAHGVTKAILTSLPDLARVDPALRDISMEEAPATAIPLHPGAVRYYRERATM